MEELERFEAETEDGQRFTIIAYRPDYDARESSIKKDIYGNLPRYRTATGYDANPIGDYTYIIVNLGLVVAKIH